MYPRQVNISIYIYYFFFLLFKYAWIEADHLDLLSLSLSGETLQSLNDKYCYNKERLMESKYKLWPEELQWPNHIPSDL